MINPVKIIHMTTTGKIVFGICIIIIMYGSYFYFSDKNTNQQPDYKNISYNINGENIKLLDGISEMETSPGSASKKITKYFGNETLGDFDGNKMEDVSFLLTQETGGSGLFYYVVVALEKDGNYIGTNGILLGDRVAPQNTRFENNEIVVNYADRKIDEPMSASPSVGFSKYLKIENEKLVEILKNTTQQGNGDIINVSNIKEGQYIESPLTVEGSARGNWYFEATFPVELLDGNGKRLVIKPAQASKEWMTEDYVPFSVTFDFIKPATATGTLILRKDNPSGEDKFDDSLAIPILFK